MSCITVHVLRRLAPLLLVLALTNDPNLFRELVDAVLELHQPDDAAIVEADA